MNILQKMLLPGLSFLALSLAGCSGLTRSDQAAVLTWWLEPYTGMTADVTAGEPLKVAVAVTAVPGLDSNRIRTLSDAAELNKYATARWADELPELVASLVGRTLEASGRFEFVSARGGSGDCQLQLDVREFFARITRAGQTTAVSVAMSGGLHCDAAAVIPVQLNASVPVGDDRMHVIVAAFQKAMNDIMKDLLRQI